jgi:ATPase subunit of ABC transporter with duplicated ATPase domains
MRAEKQVNSRAYLSCFNFGGRRTKQKFHTSGGERKLFTLAMTLKEEGNVLYWMSQPMI